MFFGSVEKPPRLSEFELEVPEKLIAQDPLEKRDECKLMVLNRKNQTIEHRKFKDVVDYFDKGDVLVMNNTRVYPARLYANKDKSVSNSVKKKIRFKSDLTSGRGTILHCVKNGYKNVIVEDILMYKGKFTNNNFKEKLALFKEFLKS